MKNDRWAINILFSMIVNRVLRDTRVVKADSVYEGSFSFERDSEVRIHLSLVENAPRKPHVEDTEPGKATAQALVGAFH